MGLVNEVVPAEELDAAVQRWVDQILLACAPHVACGPSSRWSRRTAHLTAAEARGAPAARPHGGAGQRGLRRGRPRLPGEARRRTGRTEPMPPRTAAEEQRVRRRTMRESLAPGVWGVVATPFQGSTLDVDTDSLAGLVSYYESIGATGLTVLGVFGEAAAADGGRAQPGPGSGRGGNAPAPRGGRDFPRSPARPSMRSVPSRPPPGTGSPAVMVQANSASPGVVIAHLNAIHQSTGANVVLQDYPLASGVHISTEALISVVQACGFVTAVKAEAPPTSVAIAHLDRGPRRLRVRRPRRPGAAGRAHGRRRRGDDRVLLPGSAHRLRAGLADKTATRPPAMPCCPTCR